MNRTRRSLALGASLALLWACDGHHYEGHHDHLWPDSVPEPGGLATESRPVHGFDAVAVSTAGHLIVEQTGVESLEITAEAHVLPFVRSEVRGGRLVLGIAPGTDLHTDQPIRYRLTVRDLAELEATAASRVELRGVDVPRLSLRISAASSLSGDGRAERVRLEVLGAAHCEISDLRARALSADVVGASYARVRATDALDVNAAGASVLEYFGDPVLEATVSPDSVVRRVGP